MLYIWFPAIVFFIIGFHSVSSSQWIYVYWWWDSRRRAVFSRLVIFIVFILWLHFIFQDSQLYKQVFFNFYVKVGIDSIFSETLFGLLCFIECNSGNLDLLLYCFIILGLLEALLEHPLLVDWHDHHGFQGTEIRTCNLDTGAYTCVISTDRSYTRTNITQVRIHVVYSHCYTSFFSIYTSTDIMT